MSELVQVAIAGDVSGAEELQTLLLEAGIDAAVQPDDESDGLKVLVPEDEVEAAKDAIEALTEPDEQLGA